MRNFTERISKVLGTKNTNPDSETIFRQENSGSPCSFLKHSFSNILVDFLNVSFTEIPFKLLSNHKSNKFQ